MTTPKYSKQRPTKSGWYWVIRRNVEEQIIWEAVVRIDIIWADKSKIWCSWLTGPGKAAILPVEEWSDDLWWAGPIEAPTAPKELQLGAESSITIENNNRWLSLYN
jgi:hypothetical protein